MVLLNVRCFVCVFVVVIDRLGHIFISVYFNISCIVAGWLSRPREDGSIGGEAISAEMLVSE